MKSLTSQLQVKPSSKVSMKDFDPDDTHGVVKEDSELQLRDLLTQLEQKQSLLYADGRHALLIVLQALDAGGKDGTVRHVFTAFNPLGTFVTAFKKPTAEELAHDFLWRVHHAVPRLGEVGIFNRSHYEDVLVVRVHNLVPEKVWSKRYDQINAFEELLTSSGVTMVKICLNISKDEQKHRLQARIEDPTKHWKVNPSDLEERKRWDDYMEAYEELLRRCSTDYAPWYVVPANRKWFRNLAVAQIVADTMAGMDMSYPSPTLDKDVLKFDEK